MNRAQGRRKESHYRKDFCVRDVFRGRDGKNFLGNVRKGFLANFSVYGIDCTRSSPDNRPFARSGHMVRNKLCWDASYTVGLSKQRKVGLDWSEFLCFGSPTASFASQHNLFRTM